MAAAQAGMAANGPYNTKLPAEKRPNLHETALLREQQQMLAQLQQAHASATNAVTPVHPAFGGVGGTPAVLSGLTFGGPHGPPGVPGAGHPSAALFANEQANIFAPGSEWNNTADFMAAANSANNSLLMQQTANLAQAQGAQGEQQDLFKRIDSVLP